MINVKALNELFTQNTDDKLCKQWWLMTPNGTLLAHSKPRGEEQLLRRQVAIVTLAWQEHDAATPNTADEPNATDEDRSTSGVLADRLRTLTIEADTNNIIATRVQSQLLLVLEGGVPPRRAEFEAKTTSEGPDDAQYPSNDDLSSQFQKQDSSAQSSRANSVVSSTSTTILRMQRRRLEAMANALADDFEQTGFKMPNEDGLLRFF